MPRTLKTIVIDKKFSTKKLERLLLANHSNIYYVTFRDEASPIIGTSLNRPRVLHSDCLEHTVCLSERGTSRPRNRPLKEIIEVCLIL